MPHLPNDLAAIELVDRDTLDGPAAYGKQALLQALRGCGVESAEIGHWSQSSGALCVVLGTLADRGIQRLLEANGCTIANLPEGVVVRWCQAGPQRVLLLGGTDERGLMYALLEMADRVRADGARALTEARDEVEYPEVVVRGLDRFVTGPLDEAWLHSDAFWDDYFSLLARSRFNRFVLVTGFDTAYMSPPYPFFVEAPGYPDVVVRGLDEQGRIRNRERLRHIARACHMRGIEFVLGTWQQKPWTENQQQWVDGLPDNEEGLAGYCAEGLRSLLQACPEIDGLHFRVNYEAGMGSRSSNEDFWKTLIRAVADVGRPVKLDLRAKGLTNGMIQFALSCGLDVAVPTKYWCEHTGLPYHLTQMRGEELEQLDDLNRSRRYSYSDLLHKPHWYDVIYRLWSLGSTCLFQWGDPDYVRRFVHSCRVGNAIGFEVAAPLSLKGGHAALHGDPWPLLDDPALRHGTWEDDRYWLMVLLFGRIGYSTQTGAEVWQREFRARFGEAAASVEAGYRASSKVLPLITAFHMPVHPMVHYWPEMSTGGALFAEHNAERAFGEVTYQDAEPSDPGLFYRISDYVRDRLRDELQVRYTPLQVRDWLRTFATQARRAVDAADRALADQDLSEYHATRLDQLLLADLAEYHAHKVEAAVALSYYRFTDDPDYLRTAYACAVAAREAWATLSGRGETAYHYPLEFSVGNGTGRSGQWRDRLSELDQDVARLQAILAQAGPLLPGLNSSDVLLGSLQGTALSLPPLGLDVPDRWPAGRDLLVRVGTGELDAFPGGLRLYYRATDQTQGPFHTVVMERTDGAFEGIVPGDQIAPEWDLLLYVGAVDRESGATIYPGLYHPRYPLPYCVVTVDGLDAPTCM